MNCSSNASVWSKQHNQDSGMKGWGSANLSAHLNNNDHPITVWNRGGLVA